MANQEHLDILKQGVEVWNQWRSDIDIHPDLRNADLHAADLHAANLTDANLHQAYLFRTNLSEAQLERANLSRANVNRAVLAGANLRQATLIETELSDTDLGRADLTGANLTKAKLLSAFLAWAKLDRANLSGASFYPAIDDAYYGDNIFITDISRLSRAADLTHAFMRGAHLRGAKLQHAILNGADLSEADLGGADLQYASLVETNLTNANLDGCLVYGISAWGVNLDGAIQSNLVITRSNQSVITVDNLEVAQFIYLLLNNQKIRDVINTITSKVVLILGRYTPERKAILDALRDGLRTWNYLPVLFDFEKPASRDVTETVSTLAHLARFIIVDLTDPSSAPHEVATIIPQTVVPVQPLLTLQPLMIDRKAVERREYTMFEDLRRRYHWVLPTVRYQDSVDLLASLQASIIEPAEQKAKELAQR